MHPRPTASAGSLTCIAPAQQWSSPANKEEHVMHLPPERADNGCKGTVTCCFSRKNTTGLILLQFSLM
jgi:hypothetical protein